MVLFFTHIPFVVIHTINATPPERLQHHEDLINFVATRQRPTKFQWRYAISYQHTIALVHLERHLFVVDFFSLYR